MMWWLAIAALSLVPLPRQVATPETIDRSPLPPEGYILEIVSNGTVKIEAADAAGRFYAQQTLSQLKAHDDFAKLAPLAIRDWPEFRWRGVMIDEGRYFMGMNAIRETLDAMAKYKLNVLHWHLTEDQGWRLDVPGYPELVKYGAVRPSSPKWGTDDVPDDVPYGPFFYTPSQVKEILAYAKARHIRVVPEIELPGHVRALLASHPEFSCTGKVPRTPATVTGILEDVLCIGNDEAIRYLEGVLASVLQMFPDEVIHIGGDEAPDVRWKACPKCRRRMEREQLKSTAELQGWCTAHFASFLRKRGKRVMGWDEIAAAKVPPGTILQYWRSGGWVGGSQPDVERALKDGALIVASPVDRTYFSLPPTNVETAIRYRRPVATYAPETLLPLEKAYGFDPRSHFPSAYASQVIGGECCLWSEGTTDATSLRGKLWPRGAATAEALWSAPPIRDADSLRRRYDCSGGAPAADSSPRSGAPAADNPDSHESQVRRIDRQWPRSQRMMEPTHSTTT